MARIRRVEVFVISNCLTFLKYLMTHYHYTYGYAYGKTKNENFTPSVKPFDEMQL